MYLTKQQIDQLVQLLPTDLEAFVEWLGHYGLVQGKDYTIEGDVITTTAKIATIERLFETKLFAFKKDEKCKIRYIIEKFTNFILKVIHRVQGPYSIPTVLIDHVSFVSGLTNFPKPSKAQIFRSKFSALFPPVQVPYSIKNQYNMPQNLVNQSPKNSQGVVEFVNSGAFFESDLEHFQTENNLPNATIQILGPFVHNYLESTLDIQYITGIGVGGNNSFQSISTLC